MAKFECKVCGYVYDEEAGDFEHDIKPGTKFDELPSDWECPICLLGKDEFVQI